VDTGEDTAGEVAVVVVVMVGAEDMAVVVVQLLAATEIGTAQRYGRTDAAFARCVWSGRIANDCLCAVQQPQLCKAVELQQVPDRAPRYGGPRPGTRAVAV
jgi:hypothetical protein